MRLDPPRLQPTVNPNCAHLHLPAMLQEFLSTDSIENKSGIRVGATSPHADSSLLDAYSQAVVSAAERVSPSVAKIGITQTAGRASNGEPRERHGGGSGFVFTPDGLVLTNSHFVHDATRLQVSLPYGRPFPAHPICPNPGTHFALLLLDPPTTYA